MNDYVLLATVYDKDDESSFWGKKSSRVSGLYWAGCNTPYPLGINFKNDDFYVYAIEKINDNRGVPVGVECWQLLPPLLQSRSIGRFMNTVLKDCEYKKLEKGVK